MEADQDQRMSKNMDRTTDAEIARLEQQARETTAYGTPFSARVAHGLRRHAEQLRDEPRSKDPEEPDA